MDCSVILLNSNKEEVTMVNKNNRKYKGVNGKLICEHLGDNKTGIKANDNGDDETITINLDAVSADKEPVTTFAAYINIVSGADSFKHVQNCHVRIYDPKTKEGISPISVLVLFVVQKKKRTKKTKQKKNKKNKDRKRFFPLFLRPHTHTMCCYLLVLLFICCCF